MRCSLFFFFLYPFSYFLLRPSVCLFVCHRKYIRLAFLFFFMLDYHIPFRLHTFAILHERRNKKSRIRKENQLNLDEEAQQEEEMKSSPNQNQARIIWLCSVVDEVHIVIRPLLRHSHVHFQTDGRFHFPPSPKHDLL